MIEGVYGDKDAHLASAAEKEIFKMGHERRFFPVASWIIMRRISFRNERALL